MSSPILTDNFESESVGNISGQNGWTQTFPSDDGSFTIQTTVKKTGSQALKALSTTTGEVQLKKTGTAQNSGSQQFYVRMEQTTSIGQVIFRDSSDNNGMKVNFTDVGTITWTYLGATVTIQNYNAAQFYRVLLEWSSSDHKYRVTIDNGTPTAYQLGSATDPDLCDRIVIDMRDNAIMYIDDFGVGSLAYTLQTTVGAFVLTGINILLEYAQHIYEMITQVGSFSISGINVLLKVGKMISVLTGKFILKGYDVIISSPFHSIWKIVTTTSTTWTSLVVNSTSWKAVTKSLTSWKNKTSGD